MSPTPGEGRRLRIAIVKLSSLGDVIHALPVARALRRAYPDAHLTWIVETRAHAVLRDHPDLDAVLPVDTRLWRRLIRRPAGARLVWQRLASLQAGIRAARFDVTLDAQGLIKSGLLTASTGAPLRIGFSPAWCGEWPNSLFTNRHVTPPRDAEHVVEQYLALLAPLGVAGSAPEFHIPARPDAERRMEAFLAGQGIARDDTLVALNPGASRESKRWPVPHMRLLAERLAAERGARVLVLWGPGEIERAREILGGLSRPALLAPPTDLDELTALLRRSALLVGGDTGPLHLAAALGTPCLGLYGPTPARRNRPYGSHCRGLQSPDGTMAGLDPGVAYEAAVALLGARGAES
jgi:heptosyltransferase-1